MKLDDAYKACAYHSGKVSDIVRGLSLAGIGLMWLFTELRILLVTRCRFRGREAVAQLARREFERISAINKRNQARLEHGLYRQRTSLETLLRWVYAVNGKLVVEVPEVWLTCPRCLGHFVTH